jgi:hypothetical protein
MIIQKCQPKIVLPIESAPQEEEFVNSQVHNARKNQTIQGSTIKFHGSFCWHGHQLVTLTKTLSGANKENWKEVVDEKF